MNVWMKAAIIAGSTALALAIYDLWIADLVFPPDDKTETGVGP